MTRLVVPHLGFKREPPPETVPSNIKTTIDRINTEAKDNYDFLKKAYDFITLTYKGSRTKTITNFWVAFKEPINHESGFMPCTGQNYLLRLILIKSGRFNEADIKIRITPLNFFIHQYLEIKVGGRWISVDPWANFLGVPMGKKISLFA